MLQPVSKQTAPGAIHRDINTFENRLCCSSKRSVDKKPSRRVRCVFQSRPCWNRALVPPRQSDGSPPRESAFCPRQPRGLSAEMADDANGVKPVHTRRPSYFRDPKHAHETHTNKNPPVSPATSHDRGQRRFNRGNVSVFSS